MDHPGRKRKAGSDASDPYERSKDVVDILRRTAHRYPLCIRSDGYVIVSELLDVEPMEGLTIQDLREFEKHRTLNGKKRFTIIDGYDPDNHIQALIRCTKGVLLPKVDLDTTNPVWYEPLANADEPLQISLPREISPGVLAQQPVNNMYKTRPCKFFTSQGHCKSGDACIFRHDNLVLCRRFLTGDCHRGADCAFAHVTDPSIENPASHQPIVPAASGRIFPAKYKQDVCKRFINGVCRHGESCTFKHSKDDYGQYDTQRQQQASSILPDSWVQCECENCSCSSYAAKFGNNPAICDTCRTHCG